jgi:hypothetical protein
MNIKERPEECQLESFLYYMIANDSHCKDGDVCRECSYSMDDCKHSNLIYTDGCSFRTIPLNEGESLPKAKAWCKHCKKESSQPIHKVFMNAKQAYALQCTTCKNTYVMYISEYERRYAGFTNIKGDFIPPSKDGTLPRYIKDKRERELHKSRINTYMEIYNITEEEAEKKIKESNERQQKRDEEFNKKWKEERENYHDEFKQEQQKAKSNERKKLISEGKIIYDKANRCLVNIETGEIINL